MRFVSIFIISFIFWLILTFSLRLESIATGLVVAGLTTIFFGRFFYRSSYKLLELQRYYWLFLFILVFIKECVKGNIDVAGKILHPRMPVRPAIVRVPVRLESSFARTMLACTITMIPGTIAVDLVYNDLYVHWICMDTDNSEGYSAKITGRFEKYIEKIFE